MIGPGTRGRGSGSASLVVAPPARQRRSRGRAGSSLLLERDQLRAEHVSATLSPRTSPSSASQGKWTPSQIRLSASSRAAWLKLVKERALTRERGSSVVMVNAMSSLLK